MQSTSTFFHFKTITTCPITTCSCKNLLFLIKSWRVAIRILGSLLFPQLNKLTSSAFHRKCASALCTFFVALHYGPGLDSLLQVGSHKDILSMMPTTPSSHSGTSRCWSSTQPRVWAALPVGDWAAGIHLRIWQHFYLGFSISLAAAVNGCCFAAGGCCPLKNPIQGWVFTQIDTSLFSRDSHQEREKKNTFSLWIFCGYLKNIKRILKEKKKSKKII